MKYFKIIFDSKCLIGKIILACLYCITYDFIYKNFVYELFSYLGNVEYIEMNLNDKIIWLFLSILPLCEYKGLVKLSSYINIFIYIFVYIPFIHAIFVAYNISYEQKYTYSIVLFIFILLYFKISNGWTFIKDISIKQQISIRWIEILALTLTVVYIAISHSSMHFVNIFTQTDELYSLRAENAESEGLKGIGYIQGWLSGVLYPFLLVYYLKQKKHKKSILPLTGYFLIFMVDMQKMTFFMPFALIVLYLIVNSNFDIAKRYLHSFIMMPIVTISIILYLLRDNEIVFMLASIVLLRTVCVAGWLTQLYIHFFNENPYTYYSHINIINYITNSYPYNDSIGRVVSYGNQNANANFFLMDGVAAAGLPGIIFIGLFFMSLLIIINSLTSKYKISDLVIIITPSLAYFLNASIFTTLLSSGLGFLIIILAFTSNDYNKLNKD